MGGGEGMSQKCMRCDDETYRSGKEDLYTPDGWGPFCRDCWDDLTPSERGEVSDGRLVKL